MTESERKQSISTAKADVRKIMLARRKSVENRAEKERAITARLLGLTVEAKAVLCYASMGSEVSTAEYIAAQKKRSLVCVPHTAPDYTMTAVLPAADKLMPDRMGNVDGEPYVGEVDVVVVPLAAFNDDGYRIGYGKGCYDRYLANKRLTKIGLAFDEQKAAFCQSTLDVPLDYIVTPTKLYCYKENL